MSRDPRKDRAREMWEFWKSLGRRIRKKGGPSPQRRWDVPRLMRAEWLLYIGSD
jgi:hypothetical protein